MINDPFCRPYSIGDIDVSDVVRNPHHVARDNLERVRAFMQTHLGCAPKDVARALDLSSDQAKRAFRKVRSEWARR